MLLVYHVYLGTSILVYMYMHQYICITVLSTSSADTAKFFSWAWPWILLPLFLYQYDQLGGILNMLNVQAWDKVLWYITCGGLLSIVTLRLL